MRVCLTVRPAYPACAEGAHREMTVQIRHAIADITGATGLDGKSRWRRKEGDLN